MRACGCNLCRIKCYVCRTALKTRFGMSNLDTIRNVLQTLCFAPIIAFITVFYNKEMSAQNSKKGEQSNPIITQGCLQRGDLFLVPLAHLLYKYETRVMKRGQTILCHLDCNSWFKQKILVFFPLWSACTRRLMWSAYQLYCRKS